MTTPLSRRTTGRAVVGGLVGTVVAVGAVTLGGQALDRAEGSAPVAVAALDDRLRLSVPREPVGAEPGTARAAALQAPMLDLVTPAPAARPAPDRTGERASRAGDRSPSADNRIAASTSSASTATAISRWA